MALGAIGAAGVLALGGIAPTAAFAAAPNGTYLGESGEGYDFELVTEGGNVTHVYTQTTVYCWATNSVIPWPITEIPVTPIAEDGSFSVEWTIETDLSEPGEEPDIYTSEYVMTGQFDDDGTLVSVGENSVDSGTGCSGDYTFAAAFDGDLPDPEPVPDPEVSVDLPELIESDLAEGGLTITGSGFPAEAVVTLTVAGEDAGEEAADADGAVSFTFTSSTLGVGTHEVVLTSGEWSASTSFTVTEDPADPEPTPDPTPEPTPDPTPDPEPTDDGDGDQLPDTGPDDAVVPLTAGILLVVAGAALFVARRRLV